MKKLAFLLALALALVPVLASCDNGNDVETETETETETEFVPEDLSFTDLYKTDFAGEEIFNIAEGKVLDSLLNCTYSYEENGLLVFDGTSTEPGKTKLAIYNTETDEVVYKLTNEAVDAEIVTTARVTTYNDFTFIIEEKEVTSLTDATTTTTYTLLDATGKELATKEDKSFDISTLPNDLLAIDGKVYSVKDDTLTELFELGMKEIPYCSTLTDTYNYELSYDKALVYDQKYNLVTYVKGDSNADDISFWVLNDGNILVINQYQLLDDAEEYDFAMGLEKYNVDHFIFDVETQETVYVELDFVIQFVANTHTAGDEWREFILEDAFENLAYVTPIVNKTVEASYEAYKLVDLSNELVITGVIENVIPNQSNNLPTPLAENRFTIENVAGQTFLIDGTGKVIGEITADASYEIPYEYEDVFASLFVDERGNVYDHDLNKVFNLQDGNYTPVEGLLFRAEDGTKYAVLTKGGFVELAIDPATVQSTYSAGDAICFYTNEEVNGEYANYFTVINEAGNTVLKLQTGYKSTATGSVTTQIEGFYSTDAGVVITVRVDTYDGVENTIVYKTYFCADNVPA